VSQFPDRMRNGVDNSAPVSAAAPKVRATTPRSPDARPGASDVASSRTRCKEREMTSDTTYLTSPRSTFRLNPWVARCVPLAQPTTLAKRCAADQRGANGAATAGA
jgi:hypothetical protein